MTLSKALSVLVILTIIILGVKHFEKNKNLPDKIGDEASSREANTQKEDPDRYHRTKVTPPARGSSKGVAESKEKPELQATNGNNEDKKSPSALLNTGSPKQNTLEAEIKKMEMPKINGSIQQIPPAVKQAFEEYRQAKQAIFDNLNLDQNQQAEIVQVEQARSQALQQLRQSKGDPASAPQVTSQYDALLAQIMGAQRFQQYQVQLAQQTQQINAVLKQNIPPRSPTATNPTGSN